MANGSRMAHIRQVRLPRLALASALVATAAYGEACNLIAKTDDFKVGAGVDAAVPGTDALAADDAATGDDGPAVQSTDACTLDSPECVQTMPCTLSFDNGARITGFSADGALPPLPEA